ncbi:hypothetical protein [Leptothermofonsia sp. ETS-13]|uniref:hypothetical protein n=1 Tax=Leptothermofonsia sp. ETS-13 TaxID=3035696 RepID=UPI003B9F7EDB
MSREVPALGVSEEPVQATLQSEVESVTEPFRQEEFSEENAALEGDSKFHANLLNQAVQLQPKAKVALIRKLITQLETSHIQTILEFGLREIGDRHRRGTVTTSVNHNTRLLLKKDYSYQDRGLSEPAQYYVYLRRRKPKLDRYIGALFYVPEGCVLSYGLDGEGRIVFNPPANVFQLQDCTNPSVTQIVRLICLEPPPPDYTFTKQQNDTPEIYLNVEYLDVRTYQPIMKQVYPFPACMHEGGPLDRYRWEVSLVRRSLEPSDFHELAVQPALVNSPLKRELPSLPNGLNSLAASDQSSPEVEPPLSRSRGASSKPPRRILELPATKSLTFYLSNQDDSDTVLKRMRLWVAWSEKAMPQSRWTLVQNEMVYTLMNAHFKRTILKFSYDQGTVILENSLAVLVKWFHDLSLAVSQAQNQRQYSTAQLKLAHSLFVDMSLPQKDPVVVLKKLFGVEFAVTPGNQKPEAKR